METVADEDGVQGVFPLNRGILDVLEDRRQQRALDGGNQLSVSGHLVRTGAFEVGRRRRWLGHLVVAARSDKNWLPGVRELAICVAKNVNRQRNVRGQV